MTTFGESTKGRTFPVEILSPAEVRSLMAACSRRGACGVRDRAMIATMFRGGLRVSELTALSPKDVDSVSGEVRVLRGKGGKMRVVAVDEETVALIELWMARREKLGIDPHAPLFCTLLGGRLSRVQITQKFKALAVKVGISKRIGTHGLRHARSVDLRRGGVDVVVISHALGHANVSTTNTYLSHIAPAEVIDAMRRGTW